MNPSASAKYRNWCENREVLFLQMSAHQNQLLLLFFSLIIRYLWEIQVPVLNIVTDVKTEKSFFFRCLLTKINYYYYKLFFSLIISYLQYICVKEQVLQTTSSLSSILSTATTKKMNTMLRHPKWQQ